MLSGITGLTRGSRAGVSQGVCAQQFRWSEGRGENVSHAVENDALETSTDLDLEYDLDCSSDRSPVPLRNAGLEHCHFVYLASQTEATL
jgi:hypothetical protein